MSFTPPPTRSRRRYSQAEKAAFFEAFERLGNARAAARELDLPFLTSYQWLVAAGVDVGAPRRQRHSRVREHYFSLRAAGVHRSDAAKQAGVHIRTAQDWDRGIVKKIHSRIYPDGRVIDYNKSVNVQERLVSGVRVSALEQVLDPRFLSLAEREKIRGLQSQGVSVRSMATALGRAASSISRELKRNSVEGVYEPYAAHRVSVMRRPRPKTRKILTQPALQVFVQEGLDNQWSPEQISNTLVKEFPGSQEMRVSPETIYQTLYLQARGGLKKEIQAALRTGRTRRKPHNTGLERQPRFVDPMVMISERPAEIEDRAVPGHWEGDLIVGTQNRSAIATLVERSTRFVMLAHLPGDHTAETVRDALITTMQTLPEHLRGSLTWDQGVEMARHKEFSIATDMPVYFCDPASPWQRGSNENTNGLLRQYFPKGTDLSVFGPEDLERVALQLNGRPRKTLGWKNPAECLRDLLVSN